MDDTLTIITTTTSTPINTNDEQFLLQHPQIETDDNNSQNIYRTNNTLHTPQYKSLNHDDLPDIDNNPPNNIDDKLVQNSSIEEKKIPIPITNTPTNIIQDDKNNNNIKKMDDVKKGDIDIIGIHDDEKYNNDSEQQFTTMKVDIYNDNDNDNRKDYQTKDRNDDNNDSDIQIPSLLSSLSSSLCNCDSSVLLQKILTENIHIVESISTCPITKEFLYKKSSGADIPIKSIISPKMCLEYYQNNGWVKEFDDMSFERLKCAQQQTRPYISNEKSNDNNIDNDDNNNEINKWYEEQSTQKLLLLRTNHRLNRVLTCLTHGFDWINHSESPPIGAENVTLFTDQYNNTINYPPTLSNNNNNHCENNSPSIINQKKHLSSTEAIELKLDALEFLCVLLKEKLVRDKVEVNIFYNLVSPLPPSSSSSLLSSPTQKNQSEANNSFDNDNNDNHHDHHNQQNNTKKEKMNVKDTSSSDHDKNINESSANENIVIPIIQNNENNAEYNHFNVGKTAQIIPIISETTDYSSFVGEHTNSNHNIQNPQKNNPPGVDGQCCTQ